MELTFDPYKAPYQYITDPKEAEKVLKKLMDEKVIAIDVESNGLDPYTSILLCTQIGTREISYIFDNRLMDITKIPLYKELMEEKSKIKLLQNAKFDYQFLKLKTGVEINNIYDTMLAEGVLFAGKNYKTSMEEMVKRRFGEGVIDKKLQKSFVDMTLNQNFSEDQLNYAGTDTLILFPIFEQQIQELQKNNLMSVAKLEFATAPVVAEMELRGVWIDKKRWRDIIKNLEVRRDELAEQFQSEAREFYNVTQFDLFGKKSDAININSSVQLMDLFNNKLNLDLPSTNESFLQNVINPVVNTLRDYRKYEKLISTYGEKLLSKINPKTGRVHPEFLQIRAATGRFACNNPNLQNIPNPAHKLYEVAPFRECFNPAKGYKMVVSDYSSMEMRILADLSNDEKMLKAINEGLDIHSYTASLMFNKPYSDDFKKKFPKLRQMAKPIGFGLMYGMGPQGLIGRVYESSGEELTVGESEDLINKYFNAYPKVKTFLDNQAKTAQRKGYSSTPLGRKRWYDIPERDDPDYRRKMSSIGREAKNHPIQGTNADAIKYALVFVQERIKRDNIDGYIVSTVHDEIVCEIAEAQAEDFAKVVSDEMIRAGELFLKKVKVESEPFVGDVWEH